MHRLYAIPGLGVDERLFSELRLQHAELRVLHWLSPLKRESLRDYALRLSKQIDVSQPFSLLGVSFGGMCAVEISKVLSPQKLFLISSAKTRSELPALIKLARYLPLHRLFGDAAMARLALRSKGLFGVQKGEQAALFYSMLRNNPPHYFKDTISAIASWDNVQAPEECVHLHGDADRLIPLRNIKNATAVKGGTHFMIMNHAAEISGHIDTCLAG